MPHLNRSARIRWEQAVAVYLAWSIGSRAEEVKVWREMTGRSGRSYTRRLAEADTDRLRAEYPELELAHGQALARDQAREQKKADLREARRRAAWEQVKRLNSRTKKIETTVSFHPCRGPQSA
jgi:hypothetical protein